jgi:hypothetical protein
MRPTRSSGLLAERDAQDAVAERVLDVAVVAYGIRERRLRVAERLHAPA